MKILLIIGGLLFVLFLIAAFKNSGRETNFENKLNELL